MKYLVAYRLSTGKKHLGEVDEVSSLEEARDAVRTLIPGVAAVLVLVPKVPQ